MPFDYTKLASITVFPKVPQVSSAPVGGTFQFTALAYNDMNMLIESPPISPMPKGTATRLGLAVERCG